MSRLTRIMPVTELPKTLVNLMGTLLKENRLLSWQIFDEKSSHIVVKIRFGNGHCGPTTDGQSTETVAAYRRKPPSQVKRDHARVAAHKLQQSELHADDQNSHTSDIEQARYDDVDASEHFLDPLAVSFEPSQIIDNNSILSRGDDSLTPCSETLTMPSLACGDAPLQSVAIVTSSPSSSTVVNPQKHKDSDISSVCSDITSASSCDDDDILSPDVPLCDLDSILHILRTEM